MLFLFYQQHKTIYQHGGMVADYTKLKQKPNQWSGKDEASCLLYGIGLTPIRASDTQFNRYGNNQCHNNLFTITLDRPKEFSSNLVTIV